MFLLAATGLAKHACFCTESCDAFLDRGVDDERLCGTEVVRRGANASQPRLFVTPLGYPFIVQPIDEYCGLEDECDAIGMLEKRIAIAEGEIARDKEKIKNLSLSWWDTFWEPIDVAMLRKLELNTASSLKNSREIEAERMKTEALMLQDLYEKQKANQCKYACPLLVDLAIQTPPQ